MKKLLLLILIHFAMASELSEWETNKQTKVLFFKSDDIPMVDVAIAFHAGSRYAPPGLANFTAKSTMLGSKFLNKEQVNGKLSVVGSEMHNYVDDELIVYHLRSLSSVPIKNIFDQFNSSLFTSAFPNKEIRYQRQNIQSNIDFEQDQPEEIAKEHLYKFLFPSAARFNSSTLGYSDTLENYHTSDLLQYHAKTLAQPNTTIIIVGNISIDDAKSIANDLSNKLHSTSVKLPKEALNTVNDPQTISIKPEQQQTHFLFATKLPVSSKTKDYVSYLLLNEILGGNSSSFLFQTLRDKEGLVYTIQSSLNAVDDISLLSISGQLKTKDIKQLTNILNETFDNSNADVITQKRFNIAKKSLNNKLVLKNSSNHKKLMSLIDITRNDLSSDYDDWLVQTLSTVTINDVKAALKNITTDQFYKVYVGS